MSTKGDFSFGIDFTPEFLEKYEILGTLGEGGMGQVYLGLQKSLNRKVAIKFLSGRVIMSERRIEKFDNEARLCSTMRHPNIVELYEFGGGTSAKDRPYMVFELIDGESLADRVKRQGALPIDEALDIGINICEGLQYAHEKGIVHRDIKSDNILLSKDGSVKVADFGIAVASAKEEEEAAASKDDKKEKFIPGTPAYMSPEQAKGEEATHLSDIYSTGIILYEMLTGKVPFGGETSMAIIIQHISNEPRSICEQNPAVPPQLEEVVMTALAKESSQRYGSTEELMMKLKKAKTFSRRWQSTTSLKVPGRPASEASRPLTRSMSFIVQETPDELLRRRLMYAGGGALALLVLLVPLVWLFGPEAPRVVTSSVSSGFTEAVVDWKTSKPAAGRVEAWVGTSEPRRFAAAEVTETHQTRLTGLTEGTAYRYRIVPEGGAASAEKGFDTARVEFTDIQQTPLINGVELRWQTSMACASEVLYLSGGDVKSRQSNKNIASQHRFRVSVGEGDRDREIRLAAVLEGDFRKEHVLKDFRVIDKQILLRLTEVLGTLDQDKDRDFSPEWKPRFQEPKVQKALAAFGTIGRDFWGSPDVAAVDKWQLYRKLLPLREYDVWCRLAGDDFRTGVANVLSDDFRQLEANPLAGAFTVTAPGTPYRIRLPLGDKALPEGWDVEAAFDMRLPKGGRWRRAVLEVEHTGLPALGLLDAVTAKSNHLVLFGSADASGRVPSGKLYHSFDPALLKEGSNDMVLGLYPIRGALTERVLKRFPALTEFSVVVTGVRLYLSAE